MRVSDIFRLERSQGELDFVDVDVATDTRLFVDPAALRQIAGDWASDCIALIQDFFQTVIDAIRSADHDTAIELLRGLQEPNETHLGLSRGRSRGRTLGPESAERIWEALNRSEATRTGLLAHLEDTALLVGGIGPDIVSDIATNLSRGPLVSYTQGMADYYGVTLTPGVATGRLWDPGTHQWTPGTFAPLPLADNERLLLVPKSIVRAHLDYDTDEYLRNFILPQLEHREIAAATELVRTVKYSGRKKVTNKDLIAKYGGTKSDIIRVTLAEAAEGVDLLDQYRRAKEATPGRPPDHLTMSALTGAPLPDFDALLQTLSAVPTGAAASDAYHNAVERLLTAIFSPSLTMPRKEYPIHQRRKRIDIGYTNAGNRDFFSWLAQHYPAANIFVECKNYRGDPANPELDQLGGRFSPTRGKVGLLCCRSFEDKALFIQRCRDTALDDRGFIIALDDTDLRTLAELRRDSREGALTTFLRTRFDELT